jgi:hypothetical protein
MPSLPCAILAISHARHIPGEYRSNEMAELFEDSWLARRLRLGGKCINEELVAHPGLEILTTNRTESHVFVLLREL